MTRLFHGVVRARKEGREARTVCLSTLEYEGMQEKYGSKGRVYRVKCIARGILLQIYYQTVIMQIFIAFHIISKYMGENEAKERMHRKFFYDYLYLHVIKSFYCVSAAFTEFFA